MFQKSFTALLAIALTAELVCIGPAASDPPATSPTQAAAEKEMANLRVYTRNLANLGFAQTTNAIAQLSLQCYNPTNTSELNRKVLEKAVMTVRDAYEFADSHRGHAETLKDLDQHTAARLRMWQEQLKKKAQKGNP